MNDTIKRLLNDEAFLGFVSSLYERWQDEKEYEDIADYALPIQERLTEYGYGNLHVVSMTKRPFGFRAVDGGCQAHVYVKTRGSSLWMSATWRGR